MFSSLSIAGMGAHSALIQIALSPTGRTVIRSPSQGGKSTVLYALCAALLACAPDGGAFDPAIISANRATVEVRTPNRVFSFTRTPSGSPKWTHEEVKEHPFPMSATSAKEWIRILGEDLKLPLWRGSPGRRQAVRLAFVPMAWTELATTDLETSRKLRDALVVTAGGTSKEDEAKRLFAAAGYVLDEEVFNLKVAGVAVTEANKAVDVADGRVIQAAAALASLSEPVAPDTSAADELPAMESAAALWVAHEAAVAEHQRAVEARTVARDFFEKQVIGWRATCQRIGEYDDEAVIAAKAVYRDALAAWEEERDGRDTRHAAEVATAEAEHRAAVQARVGRMADALARAEAEYAARVAEAEKADRADGNAWIEACHDRTTRYETALKWHNEDVARVEVEHAVALTAWEARGLDLHQAHGLALVAHADTLIAAEKWDADFAALPDASPPCPTCGHVPSRGHRLGLRPSVGAEPVLILPPCPVVEKTTAPPMAPVLPPEPVKRVVAPFVAPAPESKPVARVVAPLGPMRLAPTYVEPKPSLRPPEHVWVEPAPLVEPVEPTVLRPLPGRYRAAQEAAAERERHKIRLEQHGKQVEGITASQKKAEAAQAGAKATVARAAAWLKAVRDAPGEIAKRLAWCGEIGYGVHIELDPEKITNGAAVQVSVDGRSWKEPLTSQGRLVQVDFLIRHAFAKALGLFNKAGVRTLPIIVDNRQDWSGELPGDGPVIELITDQPTLVVDGDGNYWTQYPTEPLRSEIS